MLRAVLPLVLCLAVFVPSAASQSLDGAWFKVSVSASGVGISPEGDTGKAAGKFTAYMLVQQVDVGILGGFDSHSYTFTLYGEVADDEWQMVSSGSFVTPLDESAMLGDPAEGIVFSLPVLPSLLGGGDEIAVHFVAKLKVKLDKEDALKSAAFKSFGAIIPSGTSEGLPVIGGAKVSGKTVPVEKLPFTIDV